MDTKSILSELRAERQRIDKAISALETLNGSGARVQAVGKASVVWGRAARRPPRKSTDIAR